ncbi:MAG TPA: PEGA domain-containing protein [Kofleriaceae bacterium]|nr:PEGA domain-containing protein [Kofleriaceae bacterium]
MRKHVQPLVVAVASLVVAVAAPRPARADQVGVVVTGEPTLQPQLAKHLETWLTKHGHQVVPAPLPPDAVNTLIDCFVIEDEGCARGVIEKRAKAKAIVYARVDIQAGGDIEKTATVLAYWFEKGRDAVAERRFCQRCSDATLRGTADDMMEALAKASAKGLGHVKLTSTPAGARVIIDGTAVGKTPLEHDLSPGPHKITVEHLGHRSETRDVDVKRGEDASVDVTLAAEATTGGGKRSGKLLPMLATGLGGALVVTGVVMIAIDQDPGLDQPLEIRNTAPAGVGIGLVGVAVGVGGYLWYRSASKHESAPVAAITHDGAYLGWTGRF